MKYKDIKEGVGRITKQNQTVDVGPNEISIQAAKFGNKVDKDGRPPTLSKKVKGSSTNVLFNLGLAESIKPKTADNYKNFIGFCCKELGAKTPPNIRLTARELPETFGYYDIDENSITVSYAKRHQMDVMRTLAHEIVHHVQRENKEDLDGSDGSIDENEANAKAGVVLRKWASRKPHLFSETVDNLYESVLYYRQMKENLGEIAQATEIYVDMDGVLADFFGEWAKLMKVDHFSKIDKEHKIGDALQAIRDKDEFWLNLPLLPQAKQLLSVIKQIKGEYNICSSPLADDPNSEPHKREWIKKNLAFFPPKKVIITHNKPQYATQQDGTPNILIDDYGVNVDAWEAAGGTAFKYKDHKFERTANAIKQHMQEPVTEDKETNKKTQDAATQKAKPYDMPIRKDIADLIMQAYPELEKIWVTSDQYGIVGTKLKNGPAVLKLQRQLKKDGYPITVDGKAGKDTDKMFKHWLGNVIYYIKHDYLGEAITENISESYFDPTKYSKKELDAMQKRSRERYRKIQRQEIIRDMEKYYKDLPKDNGLEMDQEDFEKRLKKFKKDNPDLPFAVTSVDENFADGKKKAYNESNPFTDARMNAIKAGKTSFKVGGKTYKVTGDTSDELNAQTENFADGKKKGKSRPGRVKRSGASCNGSVTELRAKAKNASGEKAKMYHWCANMKSGRA